MTADPAAGHPLRPWMERAARIALRGHGGAEPNPMVGCVILDRAGRFAAEGRHRRCGGPHAEIEALVRAGERARGGTAVVTLEPCNHHGRTGPCSEALVRAGIARVAYGCADPHPRAAGGGASLRAAGVEAFLLPSAAAARVSAPFIHRIATGLPWVVAKWAQSADGRIAAPAGGPRWISSPASRAMVHRERARVDALLTGMGTVIADDPLLTVRGTRARRVPIRAVWDPRLAIADDRALLRTAHEVPTEVFCLPESLLAKPGRQDRLRLLGARVTAASSPRAMLRSLGERGVATVLTEAGPGLVRALVADGLVNDAWVFTAPIELGGTDARGSAPLDAAALARLERLWSGRRGGDLVELYRFPA